MGGKFGKSQRDYRKEFDAIVSIPADIYNHFSSGVHVTEDPEMVFGAFIELMLRNKKDERTPIDPKAEIKTSIFTILQFLFPRKINYLNNLQNDQTLSESNIILPMPIFSMMLSSDISLSSTKKKKDDDSASKVSARIESSSTRSSSSQLSKKSGKSETSTSDKIDESLSKVMSPYRVTLITLLKNLLSNQTDFGSAQRNLQIQTSDLLYDYILSLIHALLEDMISPSQKSTADIVNEESIRLVNSNHNSREQPTIINLYQNRLNNLSDEIPTDSRLVDLIQFYGRLFSDLVGTKKVFLKFFDLSQKQPEKLTTLGYEFSKWSITLVEKLFSDSLSLECNRVIGTIRQMCQPIESEELMAAYFHLLGKLALEVVVNKKQPNRFLADYEDQGLIHNIRQQMQPLPHEDTTPELAPEAQATLLECLAALLKEFPRQLLNLKGSNVNFKNIVNRQENKKIYSTLNTEAMRLRVEIKINLDSQKMHSIQEETLSQAGTPVRKARDPEEAVSRRNSVPLNHSATLFQEKLDALATSVPPASPTPP